MTRPSLHPLIVLVVAVFGLAACAVTAPAPVSESASTVSLVPAVKRTAALRVAVRGPLLGKVVVIDPGHQLGNSTHLRQIRRKVWAGGLFKACNTTGTQTNSGYPESAFTFSVAKSLKARLVAEGATVFLTRTLQSRRLWGPCVDARGRFGNRLHADVLVSIHGDGVAPRLHGFFVIRPAYRKGITNDIYASSRTLSVDIRAGLGAYGAKRANYMGGDGLDTRNDMGTLNLSNAPAVMVEMGNMRSRVDSARMRSATFRKTVYAAGLAKGVTTFLTRH